MQINVVLPPGTSLETSNETGRVVEQRLKQVKDITAFVRKTGRAELDEALMSAHPLTVLVDDLLERVAPPDMEQLMRRALGVEVS